MLGVITIRIFGKTKEKSFFSNGRLVEIINENDAYIEEGIDEKDYKVLER